MSVVYEENIGFNVHLHGQMSVKTSKCLFLRTFDCELYVYNTEMQFYGHMSVKHLYSHHLISPHPTLPYLTLPHLIKSHHTSPLFTFYKLCHVPAAASRSNHAVQI
jgi:hypothetical protein